MKRFIFLSALFMICMVSQAQTLRPKKVEIEMQKKSTGESRVEKNTPKKSGPLKKKIVTTRISVQASQFKQKK